MLPNHPEFSMRLRKKHYLCERKSSGMSYVEIKSGRSGDQLSVSRGARIREIFRNRCEIIYFLVQWEDKGQAGVSVRCVLLWAASGMRKRVEYGKHAPQET